MSNIFDFKPKSDRKATEQLEAFIAWAKDTLPKGIPDRVNENIQWDKNSWHPYGLPGASFTVLGTDRNAPEEKKRYMQPPFVDFVKAILVYRRVYLGKKDVASWLYSLRAIEVALVELTGERDVTKLSAVVCSRACELGQSQWTKGDNAYRSGKNIESIVKLMAEKGLLAKPFRWTSPLKLAQAGTLKQQKQDRKKKLPSRESIQALGELFNNNLGNPLDILVTSVCALLLSQPARIGELADVEYDPIVFKEGANGEQRMFLRWFAEKGFGGTLKPVVAGMEPVVKRLLDRVLPVTNEARAYAAWLEDNPDEFPHHKDVPKKGLDDPLTYEEACLALKLKVSGNRTFRSIFRRWFVYGIAKNTKLLSVSSRAILDEIQRGWDTSEGRRIFVEGKPGIKAYEFDDKAIITLRKLNVLVREKYLPRDFPYTTPPEDGKKRVKYRDALFTVRTGALVADGVMGRMLDFGVEIAARSNRISPQLSASSHTQSIFERHGYKGVSVNTHAFRHELNTEMHRAGLSQLLIDTFSGRTSMGSVYNHETVEERTQAVAAVHPKTKQRNAAARLEKIRTNAPVSLSDVIDLAEGDQDRVVHQTHLGICVHDFSSEPCPKMGSCLTCGKLGCVKGDEVKLKNLKEERDYLLERQNAAINAQSRGVIGAKQWVEKVGQDLFKCNALIKLLENPELENGDIIWNADNGWNLTKNAVAMAGLQDPKMIEVNSGDATLPSLDDLSAMLDEIEA